MTAFNTTRTLRRMFNGTAYLDRAAPRLAPAKFLVLAFTAGPFIEPAPGSNCPGRICWPGRFGVGFSLSRFLRRVRLCPLAGLGFGHVFFALLVLV